MRILHIIAQKPRETGSGVYFKNIIDQLSQKGHEQAAICGIENLESADINVDSCYPVYFSSEDIPFNVVGMSDVMPYKSKCYKDMSKNDVSLYMNAFAKKILQANKEFNPDIIICHHLYLVTSLTSHLIKGKKIYGICHGTDLRQFHNNDIMKEFIIENIKKLSGIFALHEKCKEDVVSTFNINPNKIIVSGIGYNEKIFNCKNLEKNKDIEIVYTGKISYAKGLEPLFYSFNKLCEDYGNITLNLVGMGSGSEYEEIRNLYKCGKGKVKFLGKLSQEELSSLYSRSHIFVLPSYYEGLPLVIVEALASGLSVVTSDTGGVDAWLGDKINNSGKIKYVDLPKMDTIDEPIRSELPKYIERLYRAMKDTVEILDFSESLKLDTNSFTWTGLTENILNNISL